MKIRTRMLMFSVSVSLLPLLLVGFINYVAMNRIRTDLSQKAFTEFSLNARNNLASLVRDYARITTRDRLLIEKIVEIQAYEAKKRLASAPPANPDILTTEDFLNDVNLASQLTLSEKYLSIRDSKSRMIPVSFDRQVYLTAPGIDSQAIWRQRPSCQQ